MRAEELKTPCDPEDFANKLRDQIEEGGWFNLNDDEAAGKVRARDAQVRAEALEEAAVEVSECGTIEDAMRAIRKLKEPRG